MCHRWSSWLCAFCRWHPHSDLCDRATCLAPDPCLSCLSRLLGSPPSWGQRQKQAGPQAWLCPASGSFLSVKNTQHQYLCSHFFLVVAIRFWTLGFPRVLMARILVPNERSLHSEKRPHSGLPGPTSSPQSPALTPSLQACSRPVPDSYVADSPPLSLCSWCLHDNLY